MFKKFVVLLASLGLIFQLSGCTSKDSVDDSGEDMAIDGTETGDTADVEKVEGEQDLDIAADDSGALAADSLPEDALGESPEGTASADAALQDPSSQDPAASPPMDVAIDPTLAEPTDALPPDTLGESSSTVAEAAPPVVEEPVMTEAPSSSVASTDDSAKVEKKAPAPYRKVEQTPWKEGGKLVNTVYVARSGDTWASVNKAIYGNEKTAALKKMNPGIKSRGLKVGDKVYYNSPNRPDDSSKIITFYEDAGLAPEVYIAKSGDTVKGVADKLLGSKQNWKELYATNDFESKDTLDEGTQIKYWKSAPAAPVTELAANTPAAPDTSAAMPPVSEPAPVDPSMDPANMAQVPPPPAAPPGSEGMPGSEMAPPPATDVAANAPDMNAPPPPPPPDMAEMAPPPPPPPPPPAQHDNQQPKMAGADEAANPMEEDQMTTLAAGAVLAVGLALFMIMRRRRKKELEQAIQDTHVG